MSLLRRLARLEQQLGFHSQQTVSAELTQRLRLLTDHQLELLIDYRRACEDRGDDAGLELVTAWPEADQQELALAGRILAGEEAGELAACYSRQPAEGLGLPRPTECDQ